MAGWQGLQARQTGMGHCRRLRVGAIAPHRRRCKTPSLPATKRESFGMLAWSVPRLPPTSRLRRDRWLSFTAIRRARATSCGPSPSGMPPARSRPNASRGFHAAAECAAIDANEITDKGYIQTAPRARSQQGGGWNGLFAANHGHGRCRCGHAGALKRCVNNFAVRTLVRSTDEKV